MLEPGGEEIWKMAAKMGDWLVDSEAANDAGVVKWQTQRT
jgi:hypothetical protein